MSGSCIDLSDRVTLMAPGFGAPCGTGELASVSTRNFPMQRSGTATVQMAECPVLHRLTVSQPVRGSRLDHSVSQSAYSRMEYYVLIPAFAGFADARIIDARIRQVLSSFADTIRKSSSSQRREAATSYPRARSPECVREHWLWFDEDARSGC